MSRYGFEVGDQVVHVKGFDTGYVIEIDYEYDLGDVTTCRVVWDVASYQEALKVDRVERDIQWTNKLVKVMED